MGDTEIKCAMLLSSNGTLLSSYGTNSKSFKRIIPWLVESIWRITTDVGKKFVDARGLEVMFANCKMGRIAISCIPDEDEPFFCLFACEQRDGMRFAKSKNRTH